MASLRPFGKVISQNKFNVEIDHHHNIFLNPKEDHDTTVIFLHGLNNSAYTFVNMFTDEVDQNDVVPPSCRVVLPTAPHRDMTIKNGQGMHSWFDLREIHRNVTDINDVF